MLANISKVGGGLLIAAILVIGVLANIKSSPDYSLVEDHTLAKAYMDKNKEQYAKCYNSINYGKSSLFRTTTSYIHYGQTESEVERIKQVEQSFMDEVKQRCEKQVNDYEMNYDKYLKATEGIAKQNVSLLDKMMGNTKTDTSSETREYQPSMVRLTEGNGLTNLVFTEDEVKNYYKQKLGY